MTRYLRTSGGHTMTVHAPQAGELDPAALDRVRRGGTGARPGRGNLRAR